jgi:hypothetical protein
VVPGRNASRIGDSGPASWSPDGSTIAYSRGGEIRDRYELDIWTVGPDGTGAAPLMRTSVAEFGPDWQPVSPSTPSPTAGEPCTYDLHERSITFNLRRHVIATGRVIALDGHAACESAWVRIKRRTRSGWREVNMTLTQTGTFSVELPDKPGRYQAVAVGDANCAAGRSVIRVHRH